LWYKIIDGLKWLDLDWDEQYAQSERGDLHRRQAWAIFEKGWAYRDFVPAAAAEEKEAGSHSGAWLFNPGMRELSAEESQRRADAGEPFVLRFRVPRDGSQTVEFHDAVYGEQSKQAADIEDFALLLARHFVESQAAIGFARVTVEQYPWERLGGHSFSRSGREVRTATVSHDGSDSWVVCGLHDLTLLNSAGSEFWGFARDRYTTLAETTDRILATSVNAQWRHARPAPAGDGWEKSYSAAREAMLEAFARTHSYSLQQTLFAMGKAVLDDRPELAEIRLSLPNKHHFEVDMSPFGLENHGEVFFAADRPYGLIEGTVTRDDAPPPGKAW